MKYVFDTSAYSQLVRGQAKMAQLVREAEDILIPQVTVAELRYGFGCGNRQMENEQLLARFLASSKVQVALSDNLTTDYYVEIALYARGKGKPLSHHDLWIAALAVQHEATLVSFDNDFLALPKQAKVLLLTS